MANKLQYFKLGDQAQFFYDPQSGLEVKPNAVVAVGFTKRQTKKFKVALANGHIKQATVDEYDEYLKMLEEKDAEAAKVVKKATKSQAAEAKAQAEAEAAEGSEEEETDEDGDDLPTQAELEDMTREQLNAQALIETDMEESEIEDLRKKADVIEVIIDARNEA